MKQSYEDEYYRVEKSYWIYKATRNMVSSFISNASRTGRGKSISKQSILEVGCSTGCLLEELSTQGHKVAGAELSPQAIANLKAKQIPVVKIKGEKLIAKDTSFDVVVASNVLEHIENDVGALDEWHRVLKKDGKLIVVVPAFMSLWSNHDVVNKHFTRYKLLELRSKVDGKFEITFSNYWNGLLFLPVLVVRKLSKLVERNSSKPAVDLIQPLPKWFNGLLIWMLDVETFMFKRIRFPFGISAVMVLKKK